LTHGACVDDPGGAQLKEDGLIFTSDNAGGVAPEILAAIGEAAAGAAMPYGADPVSERAQTKIREVFEAPDAQIRFVATGTAANALALASLCPPWGAIFAHAESHIERDECGAPEFFTAGAKLTLIPGPNATFTADALETAIDAVPQGFVHSVQRGAVSISQATEQGAAYSLDEIRAIAAATHASGMRLHMDGTRFANALLRLGATPAEMSWKAGVDVLCLGATKNGAMAAEAVVLFDPELAWEFELRRKRAGHLFSKMRFVAAQMDAYVTDRLWLELAGHANRMADRLAAGVSAVPGARIVNDIGANMVFAEIPLARHHALQAAGARYYLWPAGQTLDGAAEDTPVRIRLVCSHQTTAEEIDAFLGLLAGGADVPHLTRAQVRAVR